MKGLSGLFALLLLLGTLAACGGSDYGNGDPEPPVPDVPATGDPEVPDGGYDMDAGMDSVEHHGGPNGDSPNGHENGDPDAGSRGEGESQPE